MEQLAGLESMMDLWKSVLDVKIKIYILGLFICILAHLTQVTAASHMICRLSMLLEIKLVSSTY